MLLSYKSLSALPRIFRKLSGLSVDEFNIILEKLSDPLNQAFNNKGRPRKLKEHADKLLHGKPTVESTTQVWSLSKLLMHQTESLMPFSKCSIKGIEEKSPILENLVIALLL